MHREPKFDSALTQTAVRCLYLDSMSLPNAAEGRIAGRGVIIPANSFVCNNCDNVERISRNFPMPAKTISGGYTPHQGNTHNKYKPSGAKVGSEGGGGGGVGQTTPLTSPGQWTTLNAIIRGRHAGRGTLPPLLWSTTTSLVLITTRKRPSPSTTISMMVSCGWHSLKCGIDISGRRRQNHDGGGHRRSRTTCRRCQG